MSACRKRSTSPRAAAGSGIHLGRAPARRGDHQVSIALRPAPRSHRCCRRRPRITSAPRARSGWSASERTALAVTPRSGTRHDHRQLHFRTSFSRQSVLHVLDRRLLVADGLLARAVGELRRVLGEECRRGCGMPFSSSALEVPPEPPEDLRHFEPADAGAVARAIGRKRRACSSSCVSRCNAPVSLLAQHRAADEAQFTAKWMRGSR